MATRLVLLLSPIIDVAAPPLVLERVVRAGFISGFAALILVTACRLLGLREFRIRSAASRSGASPLIDGAARAWRLRFAFNRFSSRPRLRPHFFRWDYGATLGSMSCGAPTTGKCRTGEAIWRLVVLAMPAGALLGIMQLPPVR